jgi:glucose-6-phosphate isomerase
VNFRPRCDQTAAWQQLGQLAARGSFDLRGAFARDAGRFDRYSLEAPEVFADLSKNLLDEPVDAALLQLATECRVEQARDAMFAGECVNVTEQRPALHTLLRCPRDGLPDGAETRLGPLLDDVHATLDAMLDFAESVRADRDITDVVHIGIGGSDLGPRLAVTALAPQSTPGRRFHFVSNVDGHELAAVLPALDPRHTLFIVASKTFTTAETMTNAQSARRWFEDHGGRDPARHFVGLTTHVEAARAFGIERCFGFWDWVGGRYSLWSAIGLPVAVAIGAAGFRELLAGAHAMDRHFRDQPAARNLPLRLGLIDLWYRNFLGASTRNLAPYHAGLRFLPAYLQQLEMESNGKRVDAAGRVLSFSTAPILWGEPGTNGQHAFFQMLHQGTDLVPIEFVAVRRPAHVLPGHHDRLLANALAQAQAFMLGHADSDVHRVSPGNRPSTFLLLDALTPRSLGAFIALQEHRVFTSGALWGIDSFDQWGVELGKVLARDIEPRLRSGDTSGLDSSTAGLLQRLRS